MRGEFIEIGNHRLYYYAAGTRGQGDPIILIHGFPTSSHLWSDLVSLLPKGHRIVVPDLLAAGRSDPGEGADLSIRGHADRLIGLMDILGIERACLVGHHLGAAVVSAAARRTPSRVTHLLLLHPMGGDVAFTGTLAVMKAFLPLVRLMPLRLVRASLGRELTHWFANPDRSRPSVDLYLAAWLKAPRWRAFLRQLAAISAEDVSAATRDLTQLQCAVALIASDDDPAVPTVALNQVRDAIPSATLDIIRDARHFSPEESPEQVANVVARLLLRSQE